MLLWYNSISYHTPSHFMLIISNYILLESPVFSYYPLNFHIKCMVYQKLLRVTNKHLELNNEKFLEVFHRYVNGRVCIKQCIIITFQGINNRQAHKKLAQKYHAIIIRQKIFLEDKNSTIRHFCISFLYSFLGRHHYSGANNFERYASGVLPRIVLLG